MRVQCVPAELVSLRNNDERTKQLLDALEKRIRQLQAQMAALDGQQSQLATDKSQHSKRLADIQKVSRREPSPLPLLLVLTSFRSFLRRTKRWMRGHERSRPSSPR